jgi:hypothetical protein
VTGEPGGPGGDIAGDIQRWLIRSGADNMRRELGEQFRRAFGGGRAGREDAWSTATTETPPDASAEAPECAWCPVGRTARRIRESGPGLGGLSGAGDAVASAVQEALSAFDSFLSMRPPSSGTRPEPPTTGPPATGKPDHEPDGRS